MGQWMQAKVVALAVSTGRYGVSKVGVRGTGGAKGLASGPVIKRVLYSPALTRITTTDQKIRDHIGAFGYRPKGLGVALIPRGFIRVVDEGIEHYRQIREKQVDAFLAGYRQEVAQARKVLGELWDPADYPDVSVVRAKFYLETRYLHLGVPGEFALSHQDLYAREIKKQEVLWAGIYADCRQELRLRALRELVRFEERLQRCGDPVAKNPRMQDRTIRRLQDFCGRFSDLDITDDDAAYKVIDRVCDHLLGCDAQVLRASAEARDTLRAGIKEARQACEEMTGQRWAARDPSDPIGRRWELVPA